MIKIKNKKSKKEGIETRKEGIETRKELNTEELSRDRRKLGRRWGPKPNAVGPFSNINVSMSVLNNIDCRLTVTNPHLLFKSSGR